MTNAPFFPLPSTRPPRRAFALVELALVITLAAVAVVFFFATIGKQRRSSQQTESVSNLRQIGAMMAAYAADSNDGLPSFTWRANVRYGEYIASNDVAAAANQAIDIIRRRFNPAFPTSANWIPHIAFAHLTLADHAGLSLPNPIFVSPGDAPTVTLLRAPPALIPIPPFPVDRRSIVRSSYAASTAVFAGRETTAGGQLRRAPDSPSLFLYSPGSDNQFILLPKRLSSIELPSQKAYQFDRFDWFSRSTPLHFSAGNPRCGVLVFDGSASTRDLSGANDGAYTQASNVAPYVPAVLNYTGGGPNDPFNPPPPIGAPTAGTARLEFTFRQQLGRDFGPQVP